MAQLALPRMFPVAQECDMEGGINFWKFETRSAYKIWYSSTETPNPMHASTIILDLAAAPFCFTVGPTPSLGEGAKEAGSWEGCTIKEIGLPLDADGLV
jgi:hypothetical protein